LTAIRLSPRDPGTGHWYYRIGLAHLLQSRINYVVLWLGRVRNACPGLPYVHASLASAYALKGEAKRAATELVEAQKETGLWI
jgi:hypothetical protein